MDDKALSVFIPISAILGSFAVAVFSMYFGFRRREMAHRERLAMIERGLVPPALPEPQRSPRKDRKSVV